MYLIYKSIINSNKIIFQINNNKIVYIMVEVEFNYNENKNIIQCNLNDKMRDICQNYLNKINEDKNNIYFSYNGNAGNNFNEELTFQEMINSENKKSKKEYIII